MEFWDIALLLMDLSCLLMDSSIILPESIFQGSMALEQDLASVIRFLVCVKWNQSFGNFSTMVGNNDGFQGLSSTMINIAERKVGAIKLT